MAWRCVAEQEHRVWGLAWDLSLGPSHQSPSMMRKLLIPLLFLAACSDAPAPEPSPTPAPTEAVDPVATPAATAKFNLNTASGDDFRTIPDVDDRMVHEFEEYRPYASIQQFREEIGKYVDGDQVAAYEQYVYVPIDYNESDAETLQQIPGLDAQEAEALVANRPYDSNDAFLEALAAYVTEDERATAATYLAAE